MKKKILALVLIVALVASLAIALTACDPDKGDTIKFGLICLHDETSTYDKNFIDAAQTAADKLGVELVITKNVKESEMCYQAAADLVDQGCDVIFADSFGHEDYMIQAAKEFPDVTFAHATGTKAHTEKLPNYFNAFASIYEARYLAGIVAGYELNKMIAEGKQGTPTIGYVGAYTYAEVISGYTSFYLGAKSVCPTVQMQVQFTGSWFDIAREAEAATSLIGNGCWLISQHADSMGAPNACAQVGVPNVTYNISTKESCGDSYLVGSKVNWEPYFEYLLNCVANGETPVYDWTGDISTGSVVVLEYGNTVSEEAKAAVEAAKAKLVAGTLEVFDCSTFTVNGETVTSCLADVDSSNNTSDNIVKETEAIVNDAERGIVYFAESLYRSAPYFDLNIDGITLLNSAF